MFKDYIRDLKNEFKGYNMQTLLQDILAGLTVAAVALPLALAFGVSSGADAGAGRRSKRAESTNSRVLCQLF